MVVWVNFFNPRQISSKVLIPDDFMDLLIRDLDDLIRPEEVSFFHLYCTSLLKLKFNYLKLDK